MKTSNVKVTSTRSEVVVTTAKTSKSLKGAYSLCDSPECDMCAFLAKLWHVKRKIATEETKMVN